jgi:ATPase family associated with various cellular activities (AAA)
MDQPQVGWVEANHRHVAAALKLTEARLDAAVHRLDGKPGSDDAVAAAGQALHDAASGMSAPPAFERVGQLFHLTPFEFEILMLTAGVELSSSIARACAVLHGDPRRGHASFGLALWMLPDAHWTALAPEAPLRRWRIVELGQGGLTDAAIRIDERILHEIVGVPYLDERLKGSVRLGAGVAAPARQSAAVDEVARCLTAPARPVVVLGGCTGETRVAVACAALRQLGLDALVVRTADAGAALDRESLVTLVQREVMLRTAGLVIEHGPEEAVDRIALARVLAEAVAPTAMTGDLALRGPVVHIELSALDGDGRRALWEQSLGTAAAGLNGVLDEVIDEFRADPEDILRLGDEWRCRVSAGETAPAGVEHPVRTRLRLGNRNRFEGLAQVIVPIAQPDDLVLPDAQAEVVVQIEAHVRYRRTVFDDWGFARRETRGLGISALFHGPSGTGKSLAAEVIAGRLGFDLVRVDLSQVVSKYIGETEKNLRRIFDAADRGGCVLLFDEADALFGKRSEVRDSHDRYANIEVGYLLQRIEAFRGLAILTTNLKQSLDPAFLRRLRFVVAFPFPDSAERRRIWARALPAATPREGIDLDRVARLQVTGGSIRNIALHAAFLAAAEHAPVRMQHLLRASRDECIRVEKSVTAAEIGGWV